MTTLEILRGVRELLADEKRWHHGSGAFAATDDGKPCDTLSSRAACFCIAGAAFRVLGIGTTQPAHEAWAVVDAIHRAADINKTAGIGKWNDAPERTHAEVIAAIDKAIELEQATS